MLRFWEDRYSGSTYAYGTNPNVYFKEQLDREIIPGKILLPAEGEGRNGVYAAQEGWTVEAYDWSPTAHKKALMLAEQQQVSFEKYHIASLEDLQWPAEHFDLIACIFVQYPSASRRQNHQKLARSLRSGGTFILEAFSQKHLEAQAQNPRVGGPRNTDQLYTLEDLLDDFTGFDWSIAEETHAHLEEGLYHLGEGAVVRLAGTKK